jgi:hypothetical protein
MLQEKVEALLKSIAGIGCRVKIAGRRRSTALCLKALRTPTIAFPWSNHPSRREADERIGD